VTDRKTCGQELAARFAHELGAIGFATTWGVSDDGIPGFMAFQSFDWSEDYSDVDIPCFELQTRVVTKIYNYGKKLDKGEETEILRVNVTKDKNQWIPKMTHPMVYIVRAFLSLVALVTIYLAALRIKEMYPDFKKQAMWILCVEIFANAMRAWWFAVDPAFMGRVLPSTFAILLFQFSLPLGVLTSLLIANVWYRATTMPADRKINIPDNVMLLIGFALFFLQLATSVVQSQYIDSSIVTINIVIAILVQLIQAVFFFFSGIRVLLTLNTNSNLQGNKRKYRTLTFQLFLSTFGIVWSVALQALFISSFAFTPEGWMTIFFVGYAGAQLTSTMQVVAMKLLGSKDRGGRGRSGSVGSKGTTKGGSTNSGAGGSHRTGDSSMDSIGEINTGTGASGIA